MKFEKFDEEAECVQGVFVRHPRLRAANEVPAYLVDNPHITEGFRLLPTHWDAFMSMFYMHNCWLDAWTSVLTGVQAVVLLAVSVCVPTRQWEHGPGDRACLLLFFLMGILHSPSSVVYHMFGHAGISEFWFYFYQRLDFFMIFFAMNFLAVALAWYPWGHAPAAIIAVGCISFVFSMLVLYHIRKPLTPGHRIGLIACQVLHRAPEFVHPFPPVLRVVTLNEHACWGVVWCAPRCSSRCHPCFTRCSRTWSRAVCGPARSCGALVSSSG